MFGPGGNFLEACEVSMSFYSASQTIKPASFRSWDAVPLGAPQSSIQTWFLDPKITLEANQT